MATSMTAGDHDKPRCTLVGQARSLSQGNHLPLLARGVVNRVGKLKGLGNAIVPQLAAEVMRAWMECRP